MIYSTTSISLYSVNTFENFLKWVVYINTLQSPCIALEGMKSCSKFLRNLITTAHFTDRNWTSKSVYYSKLQKNWVALVAFHKDYLFRQSKRCLHIHVTFCGILKFQKWPLGGILQNIWPQNWLRPFKNTFVHLLAKLQGTFHDQEPATLLKMTIVKQIF